MSFEVKRISKLHESGGIDSASWRWRAPKTLSMRLQFKFMLLLSFSHFAYAASDANAISQLVVRSKQIRNELIRAQFSAVPDPNQSQLKDSLAALLSRLDQSKGLALRDTRKPLQPAEFRPAAVKSQSLVTVWQIPAADANTVEPLGVAESLVATGKRKQAAKFYEMALERKTALSVELTDDDRAWIMLQIAECRRDDPAAASATLADLLSKYPNSQWAPAASAKKGVMQFKLQGNK
jgi:hypothetical protein